MLWIFLRILRLPFVILSQRIKADPASYNLKFIDCSVKMINMFDDCYILLIFKANMMVLALYQGCKSMKCGPIMFLVIWQLIYKPCHSEWNWGCLKLEFFWVINQMEKISIKKVSYLTIQTCFYRIIDSVL